MKDKSRLVKVVAIGTIFVAVLVSFRHEKLKAELEDLKQDRVKQFYSGSRKPLPEPYFEKGDPSTLHFEITDLGQVYGTIASDQGDLLYRWSGDGIQNFDVVDALGKKFKSNYLNKPLMRLRRHEGTIADFPLATKVCLSKSGKVYVVYPTAGGYRLESDGHVMFAPSTAAKGSSISLDLANLEAATDEALFIRTGNKGFTGMITPNFSKELLNVPANSSIQALNFSNKFGVFAEVSEKDQPTQHLAKLVNGSLQNIDGPPNCPNPMVTVCNDSLYFVPDDAQTDTLITEYRDGKFMKLPTIPGAVRMAIRSANSKPEFVIAATVPNLDATSKKMFAYWDPTFYVTGGKFYETEKIIRQLGLGPITNFSFQGSVNTGNESFTLLENGEVLVEHGQHVYLLHRTDH